MTAETTATTVSEIDAIQSLYTDLAQHPEKAFGWAKGKENARQLGYDARWLDTLPNVLWESAAAVGNPFSLGPLQGGEVVADLGCGAGADLCIAALLVGERGLAIGIDLTPAMIEKAKGVAGAVGLINVAFHIASMESVPLPDGAADVVISNGAINLSSHKPCVFKEVYRILRPGGRLQFADMVRTAVTDAMSCGSWADCVSGTVEPEQYLDMLKAAGFEQAEFVAFTGYKTAPTTTGATFRAYKK